MANVQSWSTTAASNASADADINWAEGQAPSTVNDSARQMMAAVAKWHGDTNGSLSTGGTANAWTVTTNSAHGALSDGIRFVVKVTTAPTGATTLALDGLTAKSLKKTTGAAIVSGDLPAGSYVEIIYDSGTDTFVCIDVPKRASDIPATTISGITGSDVQTLLESLALSLVPIGTLLVHSGRTAPAGYLASGSTYSRTTYANLWTFAQAEIGAGSTFYTNGDGSTTFGIKATAGYAFVGVDAGASILSGMTKVGDTTGDATRTLITANLPPYTPAGTNTNGAASYTFSGASFQSGSNLVAGTAIAAGSGTPSQFTQPTFTGTAQGGTSTAFGIVQPSMAFLVCVKY